MQQRYDNIIASLIKSATQLSRNLFVSVGLLSLLAPSLSAETISAKGLTSMPSIQAAMIASSNLNAAMRSAAENPMDKFRRQNVRHYMSLMPAAILGVAQDFKDGKLHDKDLPTVQSVLGGFIDVNAADGYKKFLNKPSANLIPEFGENFPESFGPQGAAGASPRVVPPSVGLKKFLTDAAPAQPTIPSKDYKKEAVASQTQLADQVDTISLGFDDSQKVRDNDASQSVTTASVSSSGSTTTTTSSSSQTGESSVSDSIGFDDNASSSTGSVARSNSQSEQSLSSTARGIASELGEMAGLTIIKKKKDDADDVLGAEFFDSKKKKEDEEVDSDHRGHRHDKKANRVPTLKAKARKAASIDPTKFQNTAEPKFWRATPLAMMAELFLMKVAHAECEGGNCQGGEGGGGGGGGEQAAAILTGIAAIISAVAPMVVAGIQAEADKAIAETNAKAQIELTNITADTSKFLSNQQKEIALTQTAVSQQISQQNNNAVTGRLELQLAELRTAREDAAARERERRQVEKELNDERIALAQKQADDNLLLAQKTLNAQLTQAGLSGGFANSRNSGSRLDVGRVLTGSQSNVSIDTGNSSSTSVPTDGLAFTSSTSSQVANQSGTSQATQRSAFLQRGLMGPQPKEKKKDDESRTLASVSSSGSRARLFTSLSGSGSKTQIIDGEEYILDENGKWVLKNSKKRGKKKLTREVALGSVRSETQRGFVSRGDSRDVPSVGSQLSFVLDKKHSIVRGSAPTQRVRITAAAPTESGTDRNGDLSNFIAASEREKASEARSFVNFRNEGSSRRKSISTSGGHKAK